MNLEPALIAGLIDIGKSIAKAAWKAIANKDGGDSIDKIAKAAREAAVEAALHEARVQADLLGFVVAVDVLDSAAQRVLQAMHEAEKTPSVLEGANIEIVTTAFPVAASSGVVVDQSPPVASDHRPSWELVIKLVERMNWADENDSMIGMLGQNKRVRDLLLADMRERDRVGRERYGVPLQAGNGRRHLVDAYQEQLDKIVYLMTWLEENGIDPLAMQNFGDLPQPEKIGARVVFSLVHEAIAQAAILRELIEKGC
jgi:hypothetical protein